MTLLHQTDDDAQVREEIRELLSESMFVEAGAGTGKTAALVDRYLALVLAGYKVERIAAITFTDKAAAELRDRVRQGLEARLQGDYSEAEMVPIHEALQVLDRAHISTIHSFCLSLLRSFAVRNGIDPAFEVEDALGAERRFEERWRRFLDSLSNDKQAVETVSRLLDLGLTTYNLEALAKELWQRPELAYSLRAEPPTAEAAGWPDLHSLQVRLEAIASGNVPQDDYLLQGIQSLRAVVADLIAARPEDQESLLISRLSSPPSLTRGRQPNWGGREAIAAARGSAQSVLDALQGTIDGLRGVALADALTLVVRFGTEEARARGTEGRLVFDDLILRVRDVLLDDYEARRDLRQRFDTILIDEFQDTDPLQAAIALAFATPTEGGPPERGRLFLVGDPKQSIYRFRRADMGVYAATAETLRIAGARRVVLAQNRRSVPAVLEWTNNVFQRLIGPGFNLSVQPPYEAIHASRVDDEVEGRVWWFGEAMDMTAAQVRQLETRHIAAHCKASVERGWKVFDRARDEVRPAAYRDVAILLPARTILQPLERALAAEQIPYRVEGGSLIYATQEVRDIINCLTAIDDPSDDVAVVAALRSPAYACSDVELTRFRRDGGSFNYLAPSLDEHSGRVADGLRDLRDRNKECRQAPLAGTVESFIAERRLVEIGLLDGGSRDGFRRARFLIEQARAFEAAGPESLRSFVEWLERRAGSAVLDSEGAHLDDDEDAVRVLTIHAAKGLEFPIVFLAGLGAQPFNPAQIFGLDRDSGRVSVMVGARSRNAEFRLGPVEEVLSQEKLHADAERARLLYVAATRARDHLVVSLFRKAGTSECAAAKLIAAGALDGAMPMPVVELSTGSTRRSFEGLEVELEQAEEASFDAERQALVQGAHLRRFASATSLRHDSARQSEDGAEEEPDDDTEPWSRGRAGTHLGRAVHAALQTLPWDAEAAAIEAVATAQTVAEAVPQLAAEAAHLIRAGLDSAAAQRARTARRALREAPFAMVAGDTVVEGYIDVVIEAEDGSLEIVDWKTDHVPADAVEKRLQEYELQAGLYILGLESATDRQVSRVTYVFVSNGREAAPGEPQALKAAALERLHEHAAPATG